MSAMDNFQRGLQDNTRQSLLYRQEVTFNMYNANKQRNKNDEIINNNQ